ncbi:MAG: MqnA/MqnD/SBP family protein [Sphaerochaetaceae bacterium]
MRRCNTLIKAVVITVCLCVVTVSFTFAKGAAELQKEPFTINMAVMQGPSGFSSIGLNRNDGIIKDGVAVNLSVYPSPAEVIARLTNGEIDVAALPTNVAANLFNKGVPIRVAATVGEGMLMLLGTDYTLQNIEDLAGKTIHIPGAGSTPDQMARLLIQALGFDPETDVLLDYSIAAPAQLVQMLIAKKVEFALLPEPFVSVALTGEHNIRTLVDVQYLWTLLTGSANYPMTVLVVSDKFSSRHPEQLAMLLEAVKDSVQWVIADPEQAGAMIEQAGIMKASLAIGAIPRCNLVFRPVTEGKMALADYLTNLNWFDPQSIGGAIPDESFYLDY